MFKKNKLSGAIKLALATTMVFSLSGCLIEGSESVSTSGGSVTQVTSPKGTVVGHVQDTNGNPLVGVTIYLAGSTATTDAGGNYTFADVGVINAASANESTGHSPLSITIAAPTGYLGATVTVSPNAQIDGVQTDAALDSTATVFVDGFLAQAGTAVLPALASSVSGVLRDNDTGVPLAGIVIRLDLEEVNNSDQQLDNDDVDESYATAAYTATTAADGSFSFTNVPDDSHLRYMIENYEIDSNTSVDTDDETLINDGTILATKIMSMDSQDPYVTSVNGAMNGNPGVLNDDITGVAGSDIVINFSETIDAALIDSNSVIVWDDANGYQTAATAVLATDGASMTVTTPVAIDPGAEVHIFLLVPDFADTAGNNLVTAAAINYDFDVTATSGSSYVRLDLMVFTEANLNAPAVTTLNQQTEDTLGDDDDEAVQSSNSVFMDVNDFSADFQQLNSADNDDSANGYDASERLSDLSNELGAGDVETDIARIGFTPTSAAAYELEIQDRGGDTLDPDLGDYDFDDTSDNLMVTGTTSTVVEFTVDDTSDVFAVINSMEPGYTVIVTPLDDLGHRGTSQSQVLADLVEPTTVLQNSYGVGPAQDAAVTSFDFGDGGQQTSVGAQTIGTPYLNVTPQLLDNLDSAGDDKSVVGVDDDDDSLRHELLEFNTVDATNCNVDTPCVDPASDIYDATAYAAMNVARRIGVAMSEDIALTATAPAYSGAAALTNWVAHNDVTVSDESATPTTVNVDLVDVDIDSVFGLAADNDADIDFSAAMQDTATTPNVAGTLADANPRVVIRDAMPPMVMTSTYSGIDLVINFNEAVVPTTSSSITIGTVTFNLSQETVDAHTAGSSTLTIPATDANWIAATGSSGNYGWLEVGVDNLAMWEYDDGAGAGVVYHGELETSTIEDANENNWDGDSAGVDTPNFAYASTVDTIFGVTDGSTDADWTTAGVATTTTLLTFSYTGNHAIDMSALGVAADATAMTAAEVQAAFAFGGGATSTIGAGSSAALTTNRKALTVTIEVFTADLNPGETFGPVADISSDFDGSQSEAQVDMVLTKP